MINLDEFALNALRIFGGTTRSVGGDISQRVSQREGRWTLDAIKVYTRDNMQDSKRVSRKVVVAREAKEETVGGRDSQGYKMIFSTQQ